MKITAVHTAVVEGNYDWTFVRIDTDADGLSGLGECYTALGRTGIVRDLALLLVHGVHLWWPRAGSPDRAKGALGMGRHLAA